jgi:hypothetical protein
MALKKAADAKINTKKAIRVNHSNRSRSVIQASLKPHASRVNSFLFARCARSRVENQDAARDAPPVIVRPTFRTQLLAMPSVTLVKLFIFQGKPATS